MGDFFGDRDSFRVRHAYGESGWLLVGQTRTTFTDVAAAPATLDFEGSVSHPERPRCDISLITGAAVATKGFVHEVDVPEQIRKFRS